MKKLVMVALACFALGCSENKQKLYVYNWSDYISPEIVSEFEQKYNCKIIIDSFDDNEAMLSKLLVNSSGYDVVFPSSYAVELLRKHGLIEELDKTNLYVVVENFDSKFSKLIYEDNFKWSVPYAFSMTGICYRKDKLEVKEKSWNVLMDNSNLNRICILNDMREIIGISLKINGFSVNSTNDSELAIAFETAKKFKFASSKLDNVQYKSGIINGEFSSCMGYNSDIFQIIEDSNDVDLEFFMPKEGSTCCFDEMCILKNSNNKKLAYSFVNFLYESEIAAKNSKYICAIMPNKNMWKFLEKQDVENELFNVPESILNTLETIRYVEGAQNKYNKFWDEFKVIKQ